VNTTRRSVLCLGVLAIAGCGEEEVMQPTEGAARPATSASAKASASASAGGLEEAKSPPPREYRPDDFVESEDARDPFRDFSHLFERRATDEKIEQQRPVKAPSFALDELKLNGILTRGQSSVLLTDPTGFGWILYTGDYVGKAEMVNVGGTDGTEVPINWRVDKISEDRVVFIREDTTRPEIPPTTRVMPLYPAGDPTAPG
jgi:type IV pilus assembly protein PilP